MRAIILDAGEGRRLRPLTNSKPKCLLKINDVTILEHQIFNITEFDVKEIVIVVGYHANQVIEKVKKSFSLEVRFVLNPIYYKTNTVYSLWLARKFIKDSDFIYLNGDVVFHREVLKRLLDSCHDNCIAVERKLVSEEEVKVVLGSNNIVKAIGKNIELSKAYGEFIGIAKFSKNFSGLFINKLNEVVGEGLINEFFEVALNRALKNYEVYAVDISGIPCIEVDTYEDFNTAKKIYSKIFEEKGKSD